MDAVEFYRQFARYCSSSYCSECTIVESCKTKGKDGRDADKIVRTIEQWAKDHPVKTRQSEFLKMFPNAKIYNDVIWLCPKYIGCDYKPEENCNEISCFDCKREFWLTEVTDND